MRKLILWLGSLTATLAVMATPALGVTGAELLQEQEGFGISYVLGVVEARIVVLNSNDLRQSQIRDCIIDGHMTAETLFHATVRYIQRHPKTLGEPAVGAIYSTVAEICIK